MTVLNWKNKKTILSIQCMPLLKKQKNKTPVYATDSFLIVLLLSIFQLVFIWAWNCCTNQSLWQTEVE